MTYEEAAGLLYTGLTVWSALKTGGLSASNAADKNILVLGGSGGVGNIAIQLLKSWGAKVYKLKFQIFRKINNLHNNQTTYHYNASIIPEELDLICKLLKFELTSLRTELQTFYFYWRHGVM